MKRLFIITFLLFTFFSFASKSFAMDALCLYKDYSNDSDDNVSEDTKYFAVIAVQNNSYYLGISTDNIDTGGYITLFAQSAPGARHRGTNAFIANGFGFIRMGARFLYHKQTSSGGFNVYRMGGKNLKYYYYDTEQNQGNKPNTSMVAGVINAYSGYGMVKGDLIWEGNTYSRLTEQGKCPRYIVADGESIPEGLRDAYIGAIFGHQESDSVMKLEFRNTLESVSDSSFFNNHAYKRVTNGELIVGEDIQKVTDLAEASCSTTNGIVGTNKISGLKKTTGNVVSNGLDGIETIMGILSNSSSVTTLVKMYENRGLKEDLRTIYLKYRKGGSCYEVLSDKEGSIEISNAANELYSYMDNVINLGDGDVKTCREIIGDPTTKYSFAYYMDLSFKFMQILGPIILIVVSIVDYLKALANGDAESIKKINKKTITRMIAVLLLFMFPVVLKVILNIFGIHGNCGIGFGG